MINFSSLFYSCKKAKIIKLSFLSVDCQISQPLGCKASLLKNNIIGLISTELHMLKLHVISC